jgi:excisionase family DNA binding protein|tara:strand:+ start:295 stop:501 length:207 start_codon:yes stop_codon:yes gene_type:complete
MALKEPNLVTLKDVARYLSVSENNVRNLIRKNQIPYIVVGGIYRFDMDKVKNHFLKVEPNQEGVTNGE